MRMKSFNKDPFFFPFFLIPCTVVTLLFLLRCYTIGVIVYYIIAVSFGSLLIGGICNSLKDTWGVWIKSSLVYLATVYCVIQSFLWFKFENILSAGVIDILAATNTREAGEFFTMYVSPLWGIALLFLPIVWTWIYKRCAELCPMAPHWFFYAQTLFAIVAISLCAYSPTLFFQSVVGELWNFPMDNHVDLYQHQTCPVIEEIRPNHPDRVVVIIGESFSRSHSSLYGYDKETNPELQALSNAGNLLLFSDVSSPSTSTLEAFRQILGSYNEEKCDGRWYDYLHLLEALRTAGYHLSWVSNQGCLPMFDDVSSTYARYCDESHFNKSDGSGFDSFVLDFDYSKTEGKEAVIYHLMGQHGVYTKRYPSSFTHYHPSDYNELPSHQREVIASYDNATRYNDYIVSSLMKMYSDSDALVFYFPDHGQDLFETDPDKYGHGRLGNPESVKIGTQIPFMVFSDSKFRNNHPEVIELLNTKKDLPFNTTDFFYLALEAMGYKIR